MCQVDNGFLDNSKIAAFLNNTDKFDDSTLKGIFSLPPKQFSLLATLLGTLFIDDMDLNKQNALGNFIVSVGQSILTAAAQGQLIEDSTDPTKQMQRQIQLLRKQVNALEHRMGNR